MKAVAMAIEGILAREPIPKVFAEAAVNEDGLWLHNVLGGAWVTLVTGSRDQRGVEHWLRSNGIDRRAVEYPSDSYPGEMMVTARLSVLDRLARQNRGNLAVVDSSRVIRTAMMAHGIMVVQPHWPRHRATVDDNDLVPLRKVPEFWEG